MGIVERRRSAWRSADVGVDGALVDETGAEPPGATGGV
jgi:hypothetical protein